MIARASVTAEKGKKRSIDVTASVGDRVVLVQLRGMVGAQYSGVLRLDRADFSEARLEVVHAVDVPRPLWPGIDSLKLASINELATKSPPWLPAVIGSPSYQLLRSLRPL